MRLGTRLLIAISLIVPYNYVCAQSATVVFRGTPSTKISEGGTERRIEKLDALRSKAAECVIAQQGEHYVWVSRENIRLARVEAGSFVTYVALNDTWIPPTGSVRSMGILSGHISKATSYSTRTTPLPVRTASSRWAPQIRAMAIFGYRDQLTFPIRHLRSTASTGHGEK